MKQHRTTFIWPKRKIFDPLFFSRTSLRDLLHTRIPKGSVFSFFLLLLTQSLLVSIAYFYDAAVGIDLNRQVDANNLLLTGLIAFEGLFR